MNGPDLAGREPSSSDEVVAEGPAPRFGRRAVIMSAAAAGAGVTAGLVAGAQPALAANGDPTLLGETNSATATTAIKTTTGIGLEATASQNGQTGVAGVDGSTGGGLGVLGASTAGIGVKGTTKANGKNGVLGVDNSAGGGAGVSGSSLQGNGVSGSANGGVGVLGTSKLGIGVEGQTEAAGSSGVQGLDLSATGAVGVYGGSLGGIGVKGQTSGAGQTAVLGLDVGSGAGTGVLGNSTNGTGVTGETSANGESGVAGLDFSGGGHGTYGRSSHGTGAYGENLADGQNGVIGNDGSPSGGTGVLGRTNTGVGVNGVAAGAGKGVTGSVGAFNGLAAYFTNPHNSGGSSPFGGTALRAEASAGVYDQLRNDAGGLIVGYGAGEFVGQNGVIAAASGETAGVDSQTDVAVSGTAGVVGIGPDNKGFGVIGYGRSGNDQAGVYGLAAALGGAGIWGVATASDEGTVIGSTGAVGVNVNDAYGIGVFADGGPGTAIVSSGSAAIVGAVTYSGGGFKIDHPADPAHRFLQHSSVESPDMMNVYNGTASLDADGRATVKLPDYFEALNKDFRYQLTSIGAAAPNLHVATRIADDSFTIAGGSAAGEVSWQVTGVRTDAWAEANRVEAEVAKPKQDQGRYLHPDLFEGGRGLALTVMARMRERVAGLRKVPPAP